MLSHARIGVAALILVAWAGSALAQNAANIRAAKAATAYVILPANKGSASAFCIDPAGFFVTNMHVVKDLLPGQKVSLVLNSGEDDETIIRAAPARLDKEDDLAILQAEVFKTLTALPVGTTAALAETEQVTALGYPFGNLLALDKGGHPNVSVNVARISSMRRHGGKLQLIQLDSQLNPGNSGGPVIDGTGKVIGVVSSGVLAAGINFAVPVDKLSAMLEKPEIIFNPPAVIDAKRSDPLTLSIQTVSFIKPAPALNVEVVLSTPDGAERAFPARSTGPDTWTVTVVPLPPKAPVTHCPAAITFADSSMRCAVDDVTFQLDEKPYCLSQVRRLDAHDGRTTLTLLNGSTISGMLKMPPLKCGVGGNTMTLDASQAISIVLERSGADPTVMYRVVAKVRGAVVAEASGTLLSPAGRAPGGTGAVAAATSPASGPLPASVPPGRSVDLMPRIDIARDVDGGKWEFRDGGLMNVKPLRGFASEVARLTIPVIPTGSYDLSFTFIRRQGEQDLCVLFPVAGHGAQIWLGAFTGQNSSIEGTQAKGRSDVVRIVNGRPMQFAMSVRVNGDQAAIAVKLNGVDFMTWGGAASQLRTDPARCTRDGRTLGLAVYKTTAVEFRDLRIQAVTGQIDAYSDGSSNTSGASEGSIRTVPSAPVTPPNVEIGQADYCTILLSPKLQEALNLDALQQRQCADMSASLDAMLERAVNSRLPRHEMTGAMMVSRAKVALDHEGQVVHNLLTPSQDQKFRSMFDGGVLRPIQVHPLEGAPRPPHHFGIHSAAGVQIIYTDYAKPPEAGGSDLPPVSH
jgi:hypothetical protein